jgi:8-oxo-dGTP pyrophosphatase MutT (NUDIX family)
VAVVEQAGAIIVGLRNGKPAVLLVTANSDPDTWIFPKGHVEKGETLEAAALREAKEEAGVSGVVVTSAGELSFTQGSTTYRVHHFVVTTKSAGRPERGRRLMWCSYADALRRLTFEDSQALLREAWPHIQFAD